MTCVVQVASLDRIMHSDSPSFKTNRPTSCNTVTLRELYEQLCFFVTTVPRCSDNRKQSSSFWFRGSLVCETLARLSKCCKGQCGCKFKFEGGCVAASYCNCNDSVHVWRDKRRLSKRTRVNRESSLTRHRLSLASQSPHVV